MKQRSMAATGTMCVVMLLVSGTTAAAQVAIAHCGFNSSEDGAYYTPGNLNGQGGAANGWAGPWTSGGGYNLVAAGGSPASGSCGSDSPGDPDQHLQMFGMPSGGHTNWRPMVDWSGDFIFQFDAKLTLVGGLAGGGQIQLEDTNTSTTGKRPLNLKLQLGGFYLNDTFMLPYTGNSTFQSMVDNWVTVKIICDWETQTFDLYWTNKTDGCLGYVGRKVGWKDSTFSGTVRKLRVDTPKVTLATDGMELDRITLATAPPAGPCHSVVLLNSGVERFTVVAGSNPAPLGYALHNGGNVSHDYSVEEMSATAHSISGLFNTGVDGSGVPLGAQVLDAHYTLATNADSPATATYTSKDDGFPIPPWIATNATSRWITVRPDSDDSLGLPGQYIYRTTFTPPQAATAIYGLVAADDDLADVLINGLSTGIRDENGFQAWTMFRLNLGTTDSTLDFRLENGGTSANPTGLRVELFNLIPQDIAWLSVAPGNPLTVASQTSTAVTATIDTAGLHVGVYTAYLRFQNRDDCDPPNGVFEDDVVRRIEMTLTNWSVSPEGASRDVPVMAGCPGRTPQSAEFTVTNLGPSGNVTYTVAKTDECSWLTLDKTGPVAVQPGTGDVVTGIIDPTGLAPGTYTCSLLFTNVGTSLPAEVRTVTLHVLGTVWEYKGDTDPLAPDSAGPGLSFIVHSESPMPISQGAVEEDPLATDGKVWRLTDSATAKTKFRSLPTTWVSGQLGATLVARVRVHSYGPDTSQGLALGVWDEGTGNTTEVFYSGNDGTGVGTLKELRRNQSATVAGDDQFHIIRVTVEGTITLDRVINVYFDENPSPVISITSASSSTLGPEGFVFGAGSTAGQIDMAFDWVTATDVGAFAPAEEIECLGRSLVLDACPVPFADADEDKDVDMDDFAAVQRCINNGPGQSSPPYCNCYDRRHDGDVDAFDLLQFENCATGPAIVWSQELAPACQP